MVSVVCRYLGVLSFSIFGRRYSGSYFRHLHQHLYHSQSIATVFHRYTLPWHFSAPGTSQYAPSDSVQPPRARPALIPSTFHIRFVHSFRQMLSTHTLHMLNDLKTFPITLSLMFLLTLTPRLTSSFHHLSNLVTLHSLPKHSISTTSSLPLSSIIKPKVSTPNVTVGSTTPSHNYLLVLEVFTPNF